MKKNNFSPSRCENNVGHDKAETPYFIYFSLAYLWSQQELELIRAVIRSDMGYILDRVAVYMGNMETTIHSRIHTNLESLIHLRHMPLEAGVPRENHTESAQLTGGFKTSLL